MEHNLPRLRRVYQATVRTLKVKVLLNSCPVSSFKSTVKPYKAFCG